MVKIALNSINELLPFYVPGIVAATLTSCEAAALGRDLTEREIEKLADNVANKTYLFIDKYEELLTANGETITKQELYTLGQNIYDAVFNNAWALLQNVTEEMKNGDNAK